MVLLMACHGEARVVGEKPIALPSPPPVVVATAASVEPNQANVDRFGEPRMWLSAADSAFEHAQLDEAARLYEQILRTDNELVGFAWYKLAFIRWNQGDGARALDAMVRAVRWTRSHADANAAKLGKQARSDLVPIYAQYGNSKAAYAFFHSVLVTDSETFRALRGLAQALVDQGKPGDAAIVAADLATRTGP